MKKALKTIVSLLLGAVFAYGVYGYYHEFIAWDNMLVMYLNATLILLSFSGICAFTGKSKKGVIGKFFAGLVGSAAILFGLTFLINNVIMTGDKPDIAISIVMTVFIVIATSVLLGYYIKSKKDFKKTLCVVLSVIIALSGVAGLAALWADDIIDVVYESIDVATPNIKSVTKLPEYESAESADFYVSADGSDENDGTLQKPFKTIEKARDTIRTLDKTGKTEIIVGIMAGNYRTTGITFTAEDSGAETCPIRYCKYGDGEVIINGGVSLKSEDFTAVTDEAMLNRLSDEAKENILCIDLTKYGITAEDYGKIYAINGTASKYDGDWTGPLYSEVFFNDTRMDIARYPDENEDYLYTEEVVYTGQGEEQDGQNRTEYDYESLRNPEPDVYRVNDELANRINSWQTLNDIWVLGWWKYDWADSSSPIEDFNYEERTLTPKFVSHYGTKVGAPYYFFNVFEELTAPGEFYLDRKNAILYIYPSAEMAGATIDMSLTTNSIITISNANYISFEGITFKGTRGNAISISGNGNRVTHSIIKNVAGGAISSNGYDNLFDYNEITRTGQYGILLNGGNRTTLTPGNNRAENNLIHDWSEIYRTYQPAVILSGVGNICAHNEMYNSPHEAISWSGNNHIMEYNIIHDVCLLTNDGGTIYSGRRWDWYGNVIRYNYIYDLGSTVKNGDEEITYTPDGIYLDDNLAGQTVYGNILVNVPKYGLHLGSGRDHDVRNNIVINSRVPISYDNRARDGLTGGWFDHPITENSMYGYFVESPWQSEIWQEAYPQYKNFTLDYSNPDDPNLPYNPTNSIVSENIIISQGLKSIGNIADDIYLFSGETIKNNFLLTKLNMNKVFTDPDNGDYSIKDIEKLQKQVPGFEEIPIDEIGIQQ